MLQASDSKFFVSAVYMLWVSGFAKQFLNALQCLRVHALLWHRPAKYYSSARFLVPLLAVLSLEMMKSLYF